MGFLEDDCPLDVHTEYLQQADALHHSAGGVHHVVHNDASTAGNVANNLHRIHLVLFHASLETENSANASAKTKMRTLSKVVGGGLGSSLSRLSTIMPQMEPSCTTRQTKQTWTIEQYSANPTSRLFLSSAHIAKNTQFLVLICCVIDIFSFSSENMEKWRNGTFMWVTSCNAKHAIRKLQLYFTMNFPKIFRVKFKIASALAFLPPAQNTENHFWLFGVDPDSTLRERSKSFSFYLLTKQTLRMVTTWLADNLSARLRAFSTAPASGATITNSFVLAPYLYMKYSANRK